ncbi:MAG TPA: YciI family protein, partial [Candidatus Acidoferrum sp.]|nr:YciI family protein [Candidatus Acidoferrum sp.]
MVRPIRRVIEVKQNNNTRKVNVSTSTASAKTEYMLLFRGEHWDKGLSPEELHPLMDRVMAWFEDLQERGKVKAGQPLAEHGRIISGKRSGTVADGPFVESKEAVGGYLIVHAATLEEAVVIAKGMPTLGYGITIEVRPLLDECPIFERAKRQ